MKLTNIKLPELLKHTMSSGRERHAYGLSISDSVLEIVNVIEHDEHTGIDFFARIELEPDAINRGYIRKSDKFIATVKELTKDIPREGGGLAVVSAIPDYQVFTQLLMLPRPASHKDDLDEIIKAEVAATMPLDQKEVIIRKISYDVNPDKKEVMVFATHKTLISNWLDNFKKAGINLTVVEMESMALIRSLIKECPIDRSYFLVDIGASTADLAIFDCHGIKLSASVSAAGKHYSDTIAEKLKISFSEAEKLKISIGLSGPGNPNVVAILEGELAPLADKVKKEIEFFEQSGPRVEKIMLVGGSSAMPGIVDFFTRHINRTIERGHPWINMESDIVSSFALARKKLPQGQEQFYASATGLALRGLNRGKLREGINFLKS